MIVPNRYIAGVQIQSERFLMEFRFIQNILVTKVNNRNISGQLVDAFALEISRSRGEEIINTSGTSVIL